MAEQRVAEALQHVGITVSSVYDLVNSKSKYPNAISALITCLKEIDEPVIKEGLIRALTVREARGIAEGCLLDEFEKIPPNASPRLQLLKWTIGNAISVVITETSFERLINLVRDRRHGKSREMLAVALSRMKNPAAVEILISLLDDNELVGHALQALGKLKATRARAHIERFLSHEKPWIRREARKALAKLDVI